MTRKGATVVIAPTPDCPLGGPCDIVSHDTIYGVDGHDNAGIAQCLRCSTVYEATGWRPRKCEHCGLLYGESTHDPCLGTLEGTTSACCGHGDPARRYGIPGEG